LGYNHKRILNFWPDVLRNPLVVVKRHGKKVMARHELLFHRVFAGALPYARSISRSDVRKIEVRWLPPDPNDHSHYIPPEPD
jgi:hypothetical protein